MIFLRQKWKQKPRQWGPVSRVQASLFHNAERMGIDPDKIDNFLPFWNMGTQQEYANKGQYPLSGDVSKFSFKQNGLECLNVGNYAGGYITIDSSLESKYTLFWVGLVYNLNDYQGMFDDDGDSRNFQFRIEKSTGKLNYIVWNASGSLQSVVTDNNVQVNKPFVAVATNNGINVDIFLDGKRKTFTHSPQSPLSTIRCFNRKSSAYSPYNGICFLGMTIKGYLRPDIIAALSDNPYQLWQRVAPVMYFVPGGTGGLAEAVAGILIANGTLTRKVYYNRTVTGEF